MVYLQTCEWVGPVGNTDGPEKHGPEIIVTAEPARGNSGTHPEIIDGWLGTTNDWYRVAHGEYETVGDALAEAERQFGQLYLPTDEHAESDNEALAVRWDRNRAAGHVDAGDWLYDARHGLMREMRDGKSVEALAAQLEAEALDPLNSDNPAGIILHGAESYLRTLLDEAHDAAAA